MKDAILSIPTENIAWLESWLLGHGFPVHRQSESADRALTFYSVKNLSHRARGGLKRIGAKIVSEWMNGEPQG